MQGGFELVRDAISFIETTKYWKINTICEPQLGKRGLYPNTSSKKSALAIRNQMNVITYLDGLHDIKEIADLCGIPIAEVEEIVARLYEASLVT